MHMSNGRDLRVVAENWSPENVYVDRLYVNGKRCDRNYLTYDEIANGGELRFVMSKRPNRRRGTSPAAIPPSLSTSAATLPYSAPQS